MGGLLGVEVPERQLGLNASVIGVFSKEGSANYRHFLRQSYCRALGEEHRHCATGFAEEISNPVALINGTFAIALWFAA